MPASSLSIAALLLLLYLTASTVCSNFIPTPRQNITELPGYGPPPTAWSSGYLQADPINGGYLYYIMVESQSASPENDPVVLWLNGGPGCSSLFALFAENGPLLLNESLSLIPNPYSWNKHANVLYLDQPVGTGFSYLQNNISGYATTDAEVAAGAYRALLDFFTNAFPLLASNAFYITGESFAGRYIPAIAATIAKADFVIPLKGIAIGDGLIDPITQWGTYPEYAFAAGLIGENSRYELGDIYGRCYQHNLQAEVNATIAACFEEFEVLRQRSNFVNVYDIRLDHDYPTNDPVTRYLTQENVAQALHAKPHLQWQECAPQPYAALLPVFFKSSLSEIQFMLTQIPCILYEGQVDLIIDSSGMAEVVQKLAYPSFYHTPRMPWHSANGTGSDLYGYVRQVGNLSHVLVRKAGHMVPENQPPAAYSILQHLLEASLPWCLPTMAECGGDGVCQNGCSGHGSCANNGSCSCAPGFSGASCEQAQLQLASDLAVSVVGRVNPHFTVSYQLDPTGSGSHWTSLQLTLTYQRALGKAALRVQACQYELLNSTVESDVSTLTFAYPSPTDCVLSATSPLRIAITGISDNVPARYHLQVR